MKNLLKISLLFFASLLVFTSCNWDDEYSTSRFYVSWANAVGDNHSFKLVKDDGVTFYISANNVNIPADYQVDGKRFEINYNLLGEAPRTSDGAEAYYIRLNSMYEILTKEPVYSSEADDEVIGNDPIEVNDAWFSGIYMNIDFSFRYLNPNVKHFINLVVLEDDPDADPDNVYVELRHNAYGDGTTYKGEGYVSFDIASLIPEGKESVTVHLSYVDYDGKTHTDSGVFTAGKTAPEKQSARMNSNILNLK